MNEATFQAYRHVQIALPSALDVDCDAHPSLFLFQHSSYVKCRLCETTLRQEHIAQHCSQALHKSFVAHLRWVQRDSTTKACAVLQQRLDSLPDKTLHAQVQCKLYWTIFNQFPRQGETILQEPESLILQLEAKERRCLLELAAWKVACLANPSSGSSMPNCNNYHSWQDWSRHGWKGNKKAMRDSNGIGIIVQNVSLFLE
jgi:hypothetical protein